MFYNAPGPRPCCRVKSFCERKKDLQTTRIRVLIGAVMCYELSRAMSEFAADLHFASRQPGTIRKHLQELARFEEWSHGRAWCELSRRELQEYIRMRSSSLGASGRANMLTTLRTFFAWCVEQGYSSSSPAAGLRTPRRARPLPRSLTVAQVRQLLAALDAATGHTAARDRAMILTALYAGLRASELGALTWSSVDLDAGVIAITLSKMQRGRAVPIHDALCAILSAWKCQQGLDIGSHVFGLSGAALSGNGVGKVMRKWSKATGVPFTAHVLRHTFATWTLRHSRDLYAVSKALGHQQLAQTEIYVSADVEQVARAVSSLPGPAAW